jgi:hypothetical protein
MKPRRSNRTAADAARLGMPKLAARRRRLEPVPVWSAFCESLGTRCTYVAPSGERCDMGVSSGDRCAKHGGAR